MYDSALPEITVAGLPDPLPAELVVLDVREDDEWAAGHIAGATHIPLAELVARVDELDPQARTVVVCHSGARSARATAYLAGSGHDAVNLDGGMIAWAEALRPVVR